MNERRSGRATVAVGRDRPITATASGLIAGLCRVGARSTVASRVAF